MPATLPPIFSDDDIRALFRLSLSPPAPNAAPPPPCLELVSGAGVMLEQTARDEIEKRITMAQGTVSMCHVSCRAIRGPH